MTHDEHERTALMGGSAFQEIGMGDYLTRVAEAGMAAAMKYSAMKVAQVEVNFPTAEDVIASVPRPEPVAAQWRPMDTAPKDGRIVRLLVEFSEHATEDATGPSPTIGANNFANDEIDLWLFAGWCWTHDHFTQGSGTVLGWMPMLGEPVAAPDGWKLVPVEPTPEMIATGKSTGYGSVPIYRAMLAAAPEAPQMANDAATLRSAIRAMASMLQAREWAEHVSADPVVTDLEVQITELVGTATTLREQNAALVAALEAVTDEIQSLMAESSGVAGLHLNGDVAPWSEIEAGGRFEWLGSIPDARKVLASAKGNKA